MIGAILRKDWRLLWPFVALLTLIGVCLQWALHRYGFFGDDVAARQLIKPLTVAWLAGACGLTIALVQHDAVPAVDQDWLIRPISRTDLLLAKVLFVVLCICLPMLVADIVRAFATGFHIMSAFTEAVLKGAFVAAWLLIPVLALATLASNMTELLVLGGALIGLYALGLSGAALAIGPEGCPTCDTGVSWLQHLLQHIGVLLGAAAVLTLQYFHRRTRWSRALVLLGALALAFVQLPWSWAFGMQRWLAPAPGAGSAIAVSFDAETSPAGAGDNVAPEAARATRAARALLSGEIDTTVRYLQRHETRSAPVRIDLPMRISGLGRDELLLIDRTRFEVLASGGTGPYRAVSYGTFHDQDSPPAEGERVGEQTLYIPAGTFEANGAIAARLQLEYSLTLMRIVTRVHIAAQDGELQVAGMGRCATRVDEGATYVILRCRQIGRAPFCLAATLYRPDGEHDPAVLRCDPDYRPNLPVLTDMVRTYGLDIPLRGVAPVAGPLTPAELAQAHLLVEVYGIADHFTRTLLIPEIRLADWRR
jgi:hypothetical protein